MSLAKILRAVNVLLRPSRLELKARGSADAFEGFPVLMPLQPAHLEVLADPEFQHSCLEIRGLTLLDTPRLANLWQLCPRSHADGAIAEIGAYKGGTALHLSNSSPGRTLLVCDSFAGFSRLDPKRDALFQVGEFRDTDAASVRTLLERRGRQVEIVPGYFPDSCRDRTLPRISFAHLDVDTFEGTRDALAFLHSVMMDDAIIVVDDYLRGALGVNEAVSGFVRLHPMWFLAPMFPGQALLARGGRS
jgi:hypothetical protein